MHTYAQEKRLQVDMSAVGNCDIPGKATWNMNSPWALFPVSDFNKNIFMKCLHSCYGLTVSLTFHPLKALFPKSHVNSVFKVRPLGSNPVMMAMFSQVAQVTHGKGLPDEWLFRKASSLACSSASALCCNAGGRISPEAGTMPLDFPER